MSKYHHAPKQAWQTRVLIQLSIWLVRRNSFYFSYYSKYMNLLHNHFLQIYVCFYILMAKQTNRRKRSIFNETHLQNIFFENWRTTKSCEKKNGHRNDAMHSLKNKNRPILRGKFVLMILFIRSHFVIDRSCTTIKLHISSTS